MDYCHNKSEFTLFGGDGLQNKSKYNLLHKGDVIRTNPEPNFYGVAIVLSEPKKMELEPGRWSYPFCHIMITPLIFKHKVIIAEIDVNDLKPLIFQQFFKRADNVLISWRLKTCIDIYTNRNKSNLPVIGNIDVSGIYEEPLNFEVHPNGFHLCGDVTNHLGREAFINWIRENENIDK